MKQANATVGNAGMRTTLRLPGLLAGAGPLIGLAIGSLFAAVGIAATLQHVGW